MEITFATNRLRQLCTSYAMLCSHLGERGAKTTASHLASLRAASCLEEFRDLPGRCRERGGQLVIRLIDGRRLIFEPYDEPPPIDGDGPLDWAGVQAIRIVAITSKPTTDKKGTT